MPDIQEYSLQELKDEHNQNATPNQLDFNKDASKQTKLEDLGWMIIHGTNKYATPKGSNETSVSVLEHQVLTSDTNVISERTQTLPSPFRISERDIRKFRGEIETGEISIAPSKDIERNAANALLDIANGPSASEVRAEREAGSGQADAARADLVRNRSEQGRESEGRG